MSLLDGICHEKIAAMTHAQRETLCAELRRMITSQCLSGGGHLSGNLGFVECTAALHSVFDSSRDRFVFDVGHQSYAHKLLTGRAGRFSTLRRPGGLSGFCLPAESPHDAFVSGHSSISVSAGLGIAAALSLSHSDRKTVCILGDGALTGGQAYEGLNNAGKREVPNLLVVLNDNEMSIGKNSGGVARYLTKIRSGTDYIRAKKRVKEFLSVTKVGSMAEFAISDVKRFLKHIVYQETLFENLGFLYFGPVDGHDLSALIDIFTAVQDMREPVLVHIITKKGKGYRPAEESAAKYHAVSGNVNDNHVSIFSASPTAASSQTFSQIFGREIEKYGADPRVCLITAAMKHPTGCDAFAAKYPGRFFDAGIAEQHAVTFAAGLASCGKIPVFAVYSTFLQRAYDQLIHDVSISGLHVVLAVDRAGYVEDGVTHHGIYDAAFLKTVPGCVIFSPRTETEFCECMRRALFEEKGLAAVRYPRGVPEPAEPGAEARGDFVYSHGVDKNRLTVTYGRGFGGLISGDVLRLIKIFPFPEEALRIAREYETVEFVEEGITEGGIAQSFYWQMRTK